MTAKSSGAAFVDEVLAKFSYLAGYGFAPSIISPNEVLYESGKVWLRISYGERDSEVSMSFGRSGTCEEFSFTLFLRLVNPALEKRMGEGIAYDHSSLQKFLDDLASSLGHEGTPILLGDDLLFARMKRVRWWDFEPQALK